MGGQPAPPGPLGDHARVVASREAAETAAFAALASSPRRLEAFRSLLSEAQRLVPLREAQARELTLSWPAMRRAVLRIGQHLADTAMIPAPDDVFFLRETEALEGLAADAPSPVDTASRRALRQAQAALRPPLHVGHMGAGMRRMIERFHGSSEPLPPTGRSSRDSGVARACQGVVRVDPWTLGLRPVAAG